MALDPELMIEFEYRRAFPNLNHAQFVELMSDKLLVDRVRAELRAQFGIAGYAAMLRAAMYQATKGSVSHMDIVAKELQLSSQLKTETTSAVDLLGALTSGIAKALETRRERQKVLQADQTDE